MTGALGQDGLVVGGGFGEGGEDAAGPGLGRGEDLPGVGQEDDALTGAEGAHVDLVAVLRRHGTR